jgi:hypothetical protein
MKGEEEGEAEVAGRLLHLPDDLETRGDGGGAPGQQGEQGGEGGRGGINVRNG